MRPFLWSVGHFFGDGLVSKFIWKSWQSLVRYMMSVNNTAAEKKRRFCNKKRQIKICIVLPTAGHHDRPLDIITIIVNNNSSELFVCDQINSSSSPHVLFLLWGDDADRLLLHTNHFDLLLPSLQLPSSPYPSPSLPPYNCQWLFADIPNNIIVTSPSSLPSFLYNNLINPLWFSTHLSRCWSILLSSWLSSPSSPSWHIKSQHMTTTIMNLRTISSPAGLLWN